MIATAIALLLTLGGAPERDAHMLRPDVGAAASAPRRVVSLAPVLTETLFLLGAGERVVGVTRYCDRPAAAKALPKVGGYVDPQLERILELKPDLVVAMPSFGQRAVLERLRDHGVPVLVAFGDTIDEVRGIIRATGLAVGEPARATTLVEQLDKGLADVAAGSPKTTRPPRTVIVFQIDPLIIAGPGTFPDEALRLAGARSAVRPDSPQWPTWSLEALLLARPDVIVAAEGGDAPNRLRARLRSLNALAGVRVVGPKTFILMRPGPMLHEDVAELARLIRQRDPAR